MEITNAIKNRYEFVMLFDVENGNPNGDPDAGNMPRTDPETMRGYVTDVCIKRKIRNFVELVKEGEAGYNILIKNDRALNTKFSATYDELGLKKSKSGDGKGNKKLSRDNIAKAREYMCENFYDVRTFGAVMNSIETDSPCGIVRGPVQITFAQSIDPVFSQDITITRQAITKTTDFEKKETEMGKKSFVPYGLYRAEGYISALLAQKVTGFSEDDLELLWQAIINMFEHDRSAARGKMCLRRLYIFKHELALGNAPAHVLFDKIKVEKKPDVVAPRSFDDYTVTVDTELPSGVSLDSRI